MELAGFAAVSVDPALRALLVCPVCRAELVDLERGLLCSADRLVFPVKDGVPWLVRELAEVASSAELAAAR